MNSRVEQPALRGEWATLQPLTEAYAEITLKWRLSPRARFMNRGAQTVEQQRAWIETQRGTEDFNFIIAFGGMPVGMVSLQHVSLQHRSAALGRLLIGEPDTVGSAPVAFETERLICDYVFDELGLHKVYGDVVEHNAPMLTWRRYLGYRQDGVMRDHYLFDGVFRNAIVVSLLEDEYRSVCRPRLEGLIQAASHAWRGNVSAR